MEWTDSSFLEEAETWIRDQVEVLGPIEQPHIQPWSTVFRVPASQGLFWFKASAEQHVFEPDLIELLSRHSPDHVPEVVAVHPAHKWTLTNDAGTMLREQIKSSGSYRPWLTALPGYAQLQITAASQVADMGRLGVPDENLATLPGRITHLLDRPSFLMSGQPGGLDSGDLARMAAAMPEVVRLCDSLAEVGIPETVQHDDLNDGNVFHDGFNYRVMDWGDACVSHPFHSLTVLLRAAAYRLDLEPGGREILEMRDAYLEPYETVTDRASLVAAADIAYRTGTLARAHAWFRYLSERDPSDWGDDVEAIPYGLKKFLEGGPIGSWRD